MCVCVCVCVCDGVREAVPAPQHSVPLLQVVGSSLLTDTTSLLKVHTHAHTTS